MRINGYQCDTCADLHRFDPTVVVPEHLRLLPKSWFMVLQGPATSQEPFTFCSPRCLRQWIANQLTASDVEVDLSEQQGGAQ